MKLLRDTDFRRSLFHLIYMTIKSPYHVTIRIKFVVFYNKVTEIDPT